MYVPVISVERFHTDVVWSPGQPASLTFTARLYAPVPLRSSLTVVLTVFDTDNRPIFVQSLVRSPWNGEAMLATFELSHPHLWSPEVPNLYRAELVLTVNGDKTTVAHCFGVRHVHFEDHGPFVPNGTRLSIRGTHRHEDQAQYAAAMPDSLIWEDVQLIKRMGANFIRLAHYQQSSLVLDLGENGSGIARKKISGAGKLKEPRCDSGAEVIAH